MRQFKDEMSDIVKNITSAQDELERLFILKRECQAKIDRCNDEFYQVLHQIISLNLPVSWMISSPSSSSEYVCKIRSKLSFPDRYYLDFHDRDDVFFRKQKTFYLRTRDRFDYLKHRNIIFEKCYNEGWVCSEGVYWAAGHISENVYELSISNFGGVVGKLSPPRMVVCQSLDPRGSMAHRTILRNANVDISNYAISTTIDGFMIEVCTMKDVQIIKEGFNDCAIQVKKFSRNDYKVHVSFPAPIMNLSKEHPEE
jgi:hypothetical protein